MPNPGIISLVAGAVGLVIAFLIYGMVKKQPAGTDVMKSLAEKIHKGAMVFLKAEYKILAGFVVLVAVLLFFFHPEHETAYAFIVGAACSMLAGYIGMNAATIANVRTSWAAKEKGQGPALVTAFSGGAVMGLAVASLGLIGLGGLYYMLDLNPNVKVEDALVGM